MVKILATGAFVLAVSMPAEAVTLRDLVSLTNQGVSDEILIALVDAERSVFHLTAGEVKSLKDQGLSDRLVVHLLRTPAAHPPLPAQLAIADRPPRPAEVERVYVVERTTTVAVPMPVYIPIPVPTPRVDDPELPRAEPVYWGYGGKRRPDAWQDARGTGPSDPKPPRRPVR